MRRHGASGAAAPLAIARASHKNKRVLQIHRRRREPGNLADRDDRETPQGALAGVVDRGPVPNGLGGLRAMRRPYRQTGAGFHRCAGRLVTSIRHERAG